MSAYGDVLSRSDINMIKRHMIKDINCKQFYGMSFERELSDGSILFYSYQTNIAEWNQRDDMLYVDLDWFDCSASTRRQFSYWLTAHDFPAYSVIKKFALFERETIEAMNIPDITGQIYWDDKTFTNVSFVW